MSLQYTTVSATPHSQDLSTAIEVVTTRPTSTMLTTAVDPGILLGYFNSSTGQVELFISDQNGRRWLPITFNG